MSAIQQHVCVGNVSEAVAHPITQQLIDEQLCCHHVQVQAMDPLPATPTTLILPSRHELQRPP